MEATHLRKQLTCGRDFTCENDSLVEMSHLWQCPIVPDVAMVGEDILDIAQLALLHVLFNGVHLLLFADLKTKPPITL